MAVLSPGHQLIKPEGAVTQDSASLSTIVTVAVDGELSVAPEGLLSVTVNVLSPLKKGVVYDRDRDVLARLAHSAGEGSRGGGVISACDRCPVACLAINAA